MPKTEQRQYVVYGVGFHCLTMYGVNKTDIREQIRDNYSKKAARGATIELRNKNHFNF